MTASSPKVIEWETFEHEHFEKNPRWFWIVGIITILAAIIALLFQSILVAILALVAGFTLALYGAKVPSLCHYSLTPKGIRVNSELFPYDRLHSFWVGDEYRGRKIIVQVERFFLPHLILPLPDEIEDEVVRDYLLQYLPEERHEDSLVDMIFDSLGF